MTEKNTDQFNLSATPRSIIARFNDFMHSYKKNYNSKANKSEIGAIVLDVGLTACEKELATKSKQKKND